MPRPRTAPPRRRWKRPSRRWRLRSSNWKCASANQQHYSALSDYARITAPYDGVVTWRFSDTGSLVQAGTSNTSGLPVVTVAKSMFCACAFRCPNRLRQKSGLAIRPTCTCRPPANTSPAKSRASPTALDTSTRTMQVEIDVPNPNYHLQPGMYADVTLSANSRPNALTVPIKAIQRGEEQDQRAGGGRRRTGCSSRQCNSEWRARTASKSSSGLNEGERVIVGNLGSYQPGELVSAKASALADNGARFGVAAMPSFAIKYPFFILMLCLAIVVVGVTTVARMPVDLFPPIDIPVVVVATFYGGMPPQQIEANITDTFERFFTLGSNIDHIESRSLTGVSLIKVYFQPGTDADAAVSEIANLAMADLRRLPQGTLPPVVLKFDASSLPVCLVTLKGQGLNETQLHDEGQFNVRNQIANVPGASVPQPYGGKYRQIQFYVDPVKLEAAQMSPMDVVNVINDANKILPAGDVRIGPKDYNIYSNSQLPNVSQMNDVPLKAIGNSVLRFGDIGHAEDSSAIQYNIVRVDGQKSVYLPILKQGGNSNTIQIVNGVRDRVKHLLDVPKSLVANVVFDQSQYVKTAVANVLREGGIGLVLTALMILIFLGSMRGTISVLISIPVSCLAAFLLLNATGGTINTMVLGGLALVLSRLIDNSVVVLENIFRHMEEGEDAVTAAERGGQEVQLAVLAATFTTAIVFFPVVFLYGVSKYLFTALALGVVLALAASYLVAMTVVPLFCAKFIKMAHGHGGHQETKSLFGRFVAGFNHRYNRMLGQVRRCRRQGAGASGGDRGHHHGQLRGEPGIVSAAGRRLLSRAPIPASS